MPLRQKIFVPFACLCLMFGAVGTFVYARATVVRERSVRAGQLSSASAYISLLVKDSALSLAAASRRAVFTEGFAQALADHDEVRLSKLLLPVAVNARHSFYLALDANGSGAIELAWQGTPEPTPRPAGEWGSEPLFREAVTRSGEYELTPSLLEREGEWFIVVAAPVTVTDGGARGLLVVGDALTPLIRVPKVQNLILGFMDTRGNPVVGSFAARSPGGPAEVLNAVSKVGGKRYETLFSPVQLAGRSIGTLTIAVPAPSGLGMLGGQGFIIGFLALATLLMAFGVGSFISRSLTRRLAELADAAYEFQSGRRDVRVNADGSDELHEVAAAFNLMATDLQQSHDSLEATIEERTAELKHSLSRLDRANARLTKANEAKSVFLGNVSHELRTPLSGILLASEMLHDRSFKMFSEEKVRELSGKIHGSGRHLLALIDDLLDLSRIEAGRLDLNLQSISLSPLLAEVRSSLGPIASDKGIALDIPSGEGHTVFADPVRMKQVLINLITNAIKFTDVGGRVWAEIVPSKGEIEVAVHDTGVGISQADLRRIFKPFERAGTRPVPGTGLGLAISKVIVEAHKGRLSVESVPGEGSIFRAAFPRPKGQETTAIVTAPDLSGPTVIHLNGAAKSTVLLVEDDPATVQLVKQVLESDGYSIEHAQSVGAALASIKAHPPLLVLLDVRLGTENGLDVVKAIRKDPATRALPVVAMSAHAMSKDVKAGLAAGCNDYLVKPIGAKALLERVPSIIRGVAAPSPTNQSSERRAVRQR
ncbi:MAG TPA: ATP-binding protein [Actinomycetota bacterium]|nr:ATP-binding protein [Actinomycetota bacterium]